jgi:hypothetical protein
LGPPPQLSFAWYSPQVPVSGRLLVLTYRRTETNKTKSVPSVSSSGSQIDEASKTNADLKKNMEESEIQDTVNNNVSVNKTKKTNNTSSTGDDRNAYIKKSQG